jgi:predicted nuclease of predicted toxin-antitoxin system
VRFLLDHDVPDDIDYSLAALGHEALKLREVLPRTAPDEEILRLAAERDCVLITCNRDDFLAIAGRMSHAGLVILIRRRVWPAWEHQLRMSCLDSRLHRIVAAQPYSVREPKLPLCTISG